tara:strand:+ start:159 stop:902 length:744 start_codon:yes stop_codon:yes gene_type:complete
LDKILQFNRNVLDDLEEYISPDKLKYNSRREAANAVASYFRECNPQTAEDYAWFYATCDDYMYENAFCNKEHSNVRRTAQLYEVFRKFGIWTCLEVGAGVGTYSLAMEKANRFTTITASKDAAFKFLIWRINKYNSSIRIIDKIVGNYDCIFFMDVIEHVCDPFSFLDEVCKHTHIILFVHGFGIHREDMGGYPQHFDFKMHNYNYTVNKWTYGKRPSITKHLASHGFIKQKLDIRPFPPLVFKKDS